MALLQRSLVEASFVTPRIKARGLPPALKALWESHRHFPRFYLRLLTPSLCTSGLSQTKLLSVPAPGRAVAQLQTSRRLPLPGPHRAPCCAFMAPPSPSALSFLQEAFMVPKSHQLSWDGVPQHSVLPEPVLVMTSYSSGSPR